MLMNHVASQTAHGVFASDISVSMHLESWLGRARNTNSAP